MRILMATTKLYPPQFYGGAEMSTHAMCLMLQSLGHEVAVLSSLAPRGLFTLRNRVRRLLPPSGRFPTDHVMGYPVFRGWNPRQAVDELISSWHPDIVVAQSGEVVAIAEAFRDKGIPACVFLRHAHYHYLGGTPESHARMSYVANSQYTAGRYKSDFGLSCPVFTPLVIPDHYRTDTDRSRVVYVNPNPMKGVELALDLAAARPDLPFDIVESWTLPEWMVAEFKARAAELRNVRWLPPRSDMREIYRHAKLILMPSGVGHPEWIEAWGRVATEAQFSGIPVLASNSGGLPESVGPGGIIVDTNASFDEWLAALSRLVDDPVSYQSFSLAASEYSGRPEISPRYQIERFIEVLGGLLAT